MIDSHVLTQPSVYSFMGDLSEDQEKALEAFRAIVKERNLTNDHPQYDDYYLLRFLRARKFDMEKTMLMFTNFMNWRRENDVDNILTVRLPPFFLLTVIFFSKNDILTCCKFVLRTSNSANMKVFKEFTLITITRQTRRVVPFT